MSLHMLPYRMMQKNKKFDHITTATQEQLQLLSIGGRIKFKLRFLVYKMSQQLRTTQIPSFRYWTTLIGHGCDHQGRLRFLPATKSERAY